MDHWVQGSPLPPTAQVIKVGCYGSPACLAFRHPGPAPLPIGDKIEHTVTISPREYYIHGRKRI